ncbi:MAG: hypothetical protein WCP55_10005, partial [Lentisphaerota bacterium]
DFNEFPKLDSFKLNKWAVDYAAKAGGKISGSNADNLIRRVGDNQLLLKNEIDKSINNDELLFYCLNRRRTVATHYPEQEIVEKHTNSYFAVQESSEFSITNGFSFYYIFLTPVFERVVKHLSLKKYQVPEIKYNRIITCKALPDIPKMEKELIAIIRKSETRTSAPIFIETSGDSIKTVKYCLKIPEGIDRIKDIIEFAEKFPGQTRIESVYSKGNFQGRPVVRKEFIEKDLS